MRTRPRQTPFFGRIAIFLGLLLALTAAPVWAKGANQETVYTTRSVFMRAGPGVTWHVIATLPAGEQLTVLDQSTNWFQVRRADGTVGWVTGSYLTVNPPGSGGGGGAAGASLVPQTPNVGTLAVVTTPLLNVRSGPGLNYPIIGTVKGGETVAILAKDEQWRLIKTAGGLQGWVNSLYLSSSITPALNLGGGVATGGALGGPPAIRAIEFDHAARDSSRAGGAIVTMRVEFTGGAAPYTLTSDGFLKGSGLTPATRAEGTTVVGTLTFTELALCSGQMVHSVTLTSSGGQSATRDYFVSFVDCPNP